MERMCVEFRSFTSFSEGEREALFELTEPYRERRSLFRSWLKHPNPIGMFAALGWIDGQLVGWSAVALGTGWNMGTVGVFVHPEFRGKGIAFRLLDVLLGRLSDLSPEWSEYMAYKQGKESLFRPIIERHGFKDVFLHWEEYCRASRRADGLEPEPERDPR
ncbi:hypothetical protein A3F28_00600 [Candidatus Uhrbacteria bacterium RIFCSPHIGHO2_12_FULL_57_11]|uniref:N-acetyltransferase domain-containing protein n=2 Tax=Candidatus Uhriibacteriota TaxID=1752732 RepID=A0A1F7UN81_9BACT|nr:MAG: hypothetical protein A3D72_01905 [Candidatus Uhrbacteria bacterium RIFCSPHIGHO2_02_FULL_57_19]OGL79168.1 MAG: hypothetical protein A3F28_00600 [Candidatus Uhrbacteria bacterium RIFCSPHIGHO2_12_FULL_57_11]